MLNEIWKPINGFESEYLISDTGKVWSIRNQKVLTNKTALGYYYVSLSVRGIRQEKKIHRLVAEAFIPNPENKPTVNHINEIKTDNRIENLEWATTHEQNIHGTRIARAMANTDWKARTAKIDYAEVARKHNYQEINRKQMKPVLQYDENGFLLARFDGVAIAARSVGVNPSHLCSCLKGRRDFCGGFQWKYA